ncbi:hypothetical protein ARMGADRAFT_1036051 [Armillaria gallica]|uniref:Uncharacterized protein n=1 Tax=Armillaria gallica TaxID=47427 RepID=A0A2H3DC99_ARMGA|nr:hypothetical protein ARMGADRAFT_1036051 [Armillaria gallica]
MAITDAPEILTEIAEQTRQRSDICMENPLFSSWMDGTECEETRDGVAKVTHGDTVPAVDLLQYAYSAFSGRNAGVSTHKTTVVRFSLRTAPSSPGITAVRQLCNNNKNVLAGAIGRDVARQPSADDDVYGTVHAAFSYTFAPAISILDLE